MVRKSKAFLVFKYCNGGTLDYAVKNESFYPFIDLADKSPDERSLILKGKLQFCYELIEGIEFLHSQVTYHCDLNSQNILI